MNAKEYVAAVRKARFIHVRTECGEFVLTTKKFAIQALIAPWPVKLTVDTRLLEKGGSLFIGCAAGEFNEEVTP